MNKNLECPQCGQAFGDVSGFAGQVVACPKCGQHVDVPEQPTAATTAPPPVIVAKQPAQRMRGRRPTRSNRKPILLIAAAVPVAVVILLGMILVLASGKTKRTTANSSRSTARSTATARERHEPVVEHQQRELASTSQTGVGLVPGEPTLPDSTSGLPLSSSEVASGAAADTLDTGVVARVPLESTDPSYRPRSDSTLPSSAADISSDGTADLKSSARPSDPREKSERDKMREDRRAKAMAEFEAHRKELMDRMKQRQAEERARGLDRDESDRSPRGAAASARYRAERDRAARAREATSRASAARDSERDAGSTASSAKRDEEKKVTPEEPVVDARTMATEKTMIEEWFANLAARDKQVITITEWGPPKTMYLAIFIDPFTDTQVGTHVRSQERATFEHNSRRHSHIATEMLPLMRIGTIYPCKCEALDASRNSKTILFREFNVLYDHKTVGKKVVKLKTKKIQYGRMSKVSMEDLAPPPLPGTWAPSSPVINATDLTVVKALNLMGAGVSFDKSDRIWVSTLRHQLPTREFPKFVELLHRLPHVFQLRVVTPEPYSDRDLALVAELKGLEHLSMTGARITDEGLMKLKSTNLKRLTLAAPLVTKKGQAALKRHLPNCEIGFVDLPSF